MQALQARIESFSKTKRIKRYLKKTSSATASVKWPHPPDFKANANTLAEAGFYFDPSWDDRDSVACFICGKELSDWDADDDPFEIHYTKCQNSCVWAVVRCGLAEDLDDEGNFTFANKTRLPSSKAMERARLGTFGEDWWPHDGEADHGATSVKMARAGFVYTPQVAGDDTVTCLYCNLSLGGWEKDDDPIQEHRSRVSKSGTACPFVLSVKPTRLTSAQPSAPAKKPSAIAARTARTVSRTRLRKEESSGEAEHQSEDELAAVPIPDPPPPRAKRGKPRSTASTAPSETRRRGRITRGKSVKPSASMSRPSPPLSHAVSEQADGANPPMDIDSQPPDDPSLHYIDQQPLLLQSQDPVSKVIATDNQPHGDGPIWENDTSAVPLSNGPSRENDLGSPDMADCPLNSTTKSPHVPPMTITPTGQPAILYSHILTPEERELSLEQWIQKEISLSHERLMNDGQRQIQLFKEKAAEIRKCIDGL
ncbi:hypothetical protein PAXINDRAFT_17833 [Paxillus involutus ATCC 200175]|uniref:Inhibitor of apoptosis repeat-containing protein n=1 Tax=Paxillus involutus ATCC 200175 TaxID=664439 RepID=A0A0C9TMT1_PAXIN|nr:hypothetical protein PAXINDRAFT_17833 [Paxillus involutus ATCC 200175]